MRSRSRAAALAIAALACAAIAASVAESRADRYRDSFGPMVSVVVARAELRRGSPVVISKLAQRRVPRAFAPRGALADRREAIGLRPVFTIPAGSYVQDTQLRDRIPRRRPASLRGRVPVELSVSGAGALSGLDPGAAVDVLTVTQRRDGSARTKVSERRAGLIDLSPPDSPDSGSAAPGDESWVATLAVPRARVPVLLDAQANARETRLVPVEAGG